MIPKPVINTVRNKQYNNLYIRINEILYPEIRNTVYNIMDDHNHRLVWDSLHLQMYDSIREENKNA
jgi:hypothetical protein